MKKRTTPPTARRHSGFTLIEMLIVVAIIAILVAVSIPIVNNALERARVATDAANERSAKAEAVIKYLNGDYDASFNGSTGSVFEPYDAATGKLGGDVNLITPYGKCTQTHAPATSAHNNDNIIFVKVTYDGEISVSWGPRTTTSSFPATINAHGATITTAAAAAAAGG